MFPALILAGGLASRLKNLAKSMPKALIDIQGEPFIFHQLKYLKGQGIQRVVISIGHLGAKIKEAVGDGKNFGLEVRYSEDGPILLGTGGAVKKALPLLGEKFFVQYGDSFLPIDYLNVQNRFQESNLPALMTIIKNKNQWDVSNVSFWEGKIKEYDKNSPKLGMEYIDYGLGAFRAEAFNLWPNNENFDLSSVYNKLSLCGQLNGYEVFQRFYEIGSISGIEEANQYFKNITRK